MKIRITSQKSLVHLGSLDSFDITQGGIDAGKHLLKYLEDGDEFALRQAVDIYERLIPNENFGGEYTALLWLCKLFLSHEDSRREMLQYAEVKGFYDLLSEDGFAPLKKYIRLKYHLEKAPEDDQTKAYLRFLEDFILFNNPDRERWEKTKESLERFGIMQGMAVADVGSGPGYFTFKFADIVGPKGRVYAIETNPMHLDYLRKYLRGNRIENVEAVTSSFDGIGLPEDTRVDVAFMCSLYHNVYAAFTDSERDAFVGSIRRAIRPGGRLVLVDNAMVEEELPYHGPFIAKELIISQLSFYGFRLLEEFQFTPQRYGLIFLRTNEPVVYPDHKPAAFSQGQIHEIQVRSASSLVNFRIIGSSTSGYTLNGKRIALRLRAALEEGDRASLKQARAQYLALCPKERIGDDYTALLWFADYALADQDGRARMTQDPLVAAYCEYFADDDFRVLKRYLRYKYDLDRPFPDVWDDRVRDYEGHEVEHSQINEWSEYLTFNNPNRFMWEKTGEMLDFLAIRPDERIADIGCGSGFFSYRFARLAPRGKVYATETNAQALKYVTNIARECALNIETKISKLNDICLDEDSVDTVFMCSMYHAVYTASIEFVKDAFIESVKKALVKGGRLVIVDNDITPRDAPAYFGSSIAKELCIAQLSYYGFRLEAYRQFVPQRYVLVFGRAEE